jgi:hypothetical protein
MRRRGIPICKAEAVSPSSRRKPRPNKGNNILDTPPAPGDLPSDEEYTEWLASLLPEPGVLAVLKCTIDESGTHKGAAVLCVGGCVATTRQWGLLAKEWKPRIKHLRKGYHAKRADCEELNVELAELMRVRLDHTLAITIIEDEYNAYAPPRFRSRVGGAYALAVHALVFEVGQWCAKKEINHVAYLLESGHRNQPYVDRVFQYFMAVPHLRKQSRLWSWSWGSKADTSLHPPDLLSHEIATFGPLGKLLWERTEQKHIGPEEIKELADVVLPLWDKQKRERRRARDR